jgi:hypothetical protein
MTTKTATAKKKWLPKHKRWVHFTHRDTLRAKKTHPKCTASSVPTTSLPVDCTGNATCSCPMLGNDTYGDCGPVMCAHIDQIRTFGQGKPGFTECSVDQAALVAQYEAVSGGDNGTDEDMLVGTSGIWITGIAGDTTQTVCDHMDFDITNGPLCQYMIDQFYAVNMAWSVPDAFLQDFQTGASFLSAMTPDPNNGHFTAQADVDASGNVRLWTWGGWCWVSPAFIASVDPEAFVTFSALQFSKATGLDSHGRHVSDQAAAWIALGGNASNVNPIVAMFPPKAAA